MSAYLSRYQMEYIERCILSSEDDIQYIVFFINTISKTSYMHQYKFLHILHVAHFHANQNLCYV
jgi:hypothetical protein